MKTLFIKNPVLVVLALMALGVRGAASPFTVHLTLTDTSNLPVNGASFVVGTSATGTTTMTNGTASTVNGVAFGTTTTTSISLKITDYADGTGQYAVTGDTGSTADGIHLVLTASKSSTTLVQSVFAVNLGSEFNTQANTLTQALGANNGASGNGIAINSLSTKIGTPAGATLVADVGSAKSAADAATAAASALPSAPAIRAEIDANSTKFASLLSRIPQSVQFDGGGYILARAKINEDKNGYGVSSLPATAPAGYGGGTGSPIHH